MKRIAFFWDFQNKKLDWSGIGFAALGVLAALLLARGLR
jgi:hypothetical protein